MNALAALDRARAAWERSQPQMVIDGWAGELDSLDAKRAAVGDFAAAASSVSSPPLPDLPPEAGGLASQTYDGPGALTSESALRGQGGAV